MGTSLELHKTPVYQRNFKRLSDEIRAHQASKEHPSDRPVSNEEGLRRAAELKRAFRDYYARPADTFDDDKVFPLE
jgi:hypothetical protein